MPSSIYNEVDRFTNERHSTTIGTIGLPRLARALLTLIGSCRIYYVFNIKARSTFTYYPCNRFAKETICSSSRVWEKFCSLFDIMAFITNVDQLQALLDGCSSTHDWELLLESILIPDEWIPMAYARLSELTATVYV